MNKGNEKKLNEKLSFKEKMAILRVVLKDYAELVKEWLVDYGKVILPLILIVCVFITVVIALKARERAAAASAEALSILESNKEEVNEII